MAESVLLGAAIGGGGAMLSGQDPLKGAAIGGAMGGATAGFGGAGVESAATSTTNPALVSAGSTMPASTVATGATTNPALTNSVGQSSNAFTQFGRDASDAFSGVGDTIGQGFDYVNDKTGMENKDWTMMAMNQGVNMMQPTPEQPIQAAPMGQGISRPNVDLSQSAGSLLSSNPTTSGSGGQQLTPEQLQKLKQQGLL
jgi:hypothetical protein